MDICHYELFAYDKIRYCEFVNALSISAGFPLDKIGTQDDFFISILNGQALDVSAFHK